MDSLVVLARIALAFVFALSGLSKMLDRAGATAAAAALGVPRRLAGPVGVALPLVELTVAGLLVPGATGWWGALAAVGLLAVFSATVATNLARGRRPKCNCFGQLSDAPIGPWTLARNGVLLAAAVFVVISESADSQLGVLRWVEAKTAVGQLPDVVSLLGAVVFLQGLAIAYLIGRQRVLTAQISLGPTAPATATDAGAPPGAGLPLGSAAPPFALQGLHGETTTLASLTARGRPALLLFMDPNCGPCNGMTPEVAEWQRAHGEQLTIAVLTTGSVEENLAKSTEYGIERVLLDPRGATAASFEFAGTPGAVLVSAEGKIASAVAGGAGQIRDLLAQALGHVPAEPEPPLAELEIGDPAPAFHLHSLDGAHITHQSLLGQLSLLVFWDPLCSFCQGLVDDLKARESALRDAGVNVLIVAAGSEEHNRAQGFQSPVALDPGNKVTRGYGAFGTPIARLVDAEGRIASEAAPGRDEVLALVDRAISLSSLAASMSTPD